MSQVEDSQINSRRYMKEFEYMSVPAKGVTKHWLCPRVDVERGVSVIVVSTMVLCNIL